MTKDRNQGSEIRGQHAEQMKDLLRAALPPVGVDAEPDRDLWPAMLRRMQDEEAHGAAGVPWFDWVLGGGVLAFAAIAPRTIPVILYYL